MMNDSMKTLKGFTLIEVLAALAILAISLTALIAASNETTQNLHYLRDKTIAHWIAMNVAAEARLGLITLPKAPKLQKAKAKALGEEWQWYANVDKTDVNSILRIQIRVSNSRYSNIIETVGFMREPLQ